MNPAYPVHPSIQVLPISVNCFRDPSLQESAATRADGNDAKGVLVGGEGDR